MIALDYGFNLLLFSVIPLKPSVTFVVLQVTSIRQIDILFSSASLHDQAGTVFFLIVSWSSPRPSSRMSPIEHPLPLPAYCGRRL
jgi:hypothetical protein